MKRVPHREGIEMVQAEAVNHENLAFHRTTLAAFQPAKDLDAYCNDYPTATPPPWESA